jgi:hypothetical protein
MQTKATSAVSLNRLVNKFLTEHISMPGFPKIIVTRGFLFKFLADLGWDKSERGFRSLDYMVFARSAFGVPLTSETKRDQLLRKIRGGFRRR